MKIARQLFAFLAAGMLVASIASVPAFSSTSATITGRVTDSQGFVVPAAQVQATNILTNISYASETNEDGLYRIANLPPGEYRVIVQKQGFASIAKPGVELHVQDIITLNFAMQIGSVTQTITVQAGTPLVNTESGSVGTVVDRRFVELLPLNGRSFNTLLLLTPGVTLSPSVIGSSGQFSISGHRANANYFQVDGVSANFGVGITGRLGQTGGGGIQAFNAYGGTSSLVSVDATEEFRVETSTFAPEFGRTPGGQVIISTRSGSNEFHGGVFDYFRNDVLDANDWFANAAGLAKAPLRQNDFGGFLGGPIIRNRMFFFVSYEGLRLRLPQTRVIQVPSLTVRSSALPAIKPLLDAYPIPNGPVSPTGATAQFTGVYSDERSMDATSLRIDHTFRSSLSVFGRYNQSPSESKQRTNSLSQMTATQVNTRTLTFGLTMSPGPRLSYSFRGNYSTLEAGARDALDAFEGAIPPDPDVLAPPPFTRSLFTPRGLSSYNVGPSSDNRERQVNVVNQVAFTSGVHQPKFGVDYANLLVSQEGFVGAQYTANSISTFASTGIVNSLFTSMGNPAKMRFHLTSVFAQDVWRVNSRLSLTYGLRWEINPAPKGLDGTTLSAWENVNDPLATVLAPLGTPLWETTFTNFAPRLGVAYQLTPTGDLVIRGGWGLFYDLGTGASGNLTTAFPNFANLFTSNQTVPLSNTASLIPVISADPPYRSFLVFGFSPDLKLPRSQQWNVALEKSFGIHHVLSVTYVGQSGSRLLRQNIESPSPANPNFTNVLQFLLTRNGDSSDYNALQMQFRRPLWKGLQGLASYTWAHSIDTASEDVVGATAQTVIPARNDRGSSSFDVRHNFSAAVIYLPPAVRNLPLLARLTEDWTLTAVVSARSGFPINVTSVLTRFQGAGLNAAIRPDLVPGQPVWLRDSTAPGGKVLNGAAFSVPTTPRQGTLGRNSISGFGMLQADFSLGRDFRIVDKAKLKFQADFFNLFNHPSFTSPLGFIDLGSQFLRSTSMLNRGITGLDPLYQQGGPRSIQLLLKLTF